MVVPGPVPTTMELSSRGSDGRSSSSKGQDPSHLYAALSSSDSLTIKCHALVHFVGQCMGKFPGDTQLQGCKAPIAGPCFVIINDSLSEAGGQGTTLVQSVGQG